MKNGYILRKNIKMWKKNAIINKISYNSTIWYTIKK